MSSVRHIGTIFLFALIHPVALRSFSNITSNDPVPMYTAEYPYDFVSLWKRDYFRGLDDEQHCERIVFAVSPFRQTADEGKDIEQNRVPIGDLHGRWNMLGLFYPTDMDNWYNTADPCNLLPKVRLVKTQNQQELGCPLVQYICPPHTPEPGCPTILDPTKSDPKHEVGFFSIPIAYRKYGVRFQADFRIYGNFGARLQTGVADLTQTVTDWIDLTLTSSGTNLTGDCTEEGCIDTSAACKKLIVENIMLQRNVLANALDLSIRDYHRLGMEDLQVSLFWQKIIPVNDDCDGWPYFLLVPYVAFEAIVPISKRINPSCLFALPLGNNGHSGLGFSVGMDFDFIDSIEIGFQASVTKYNALPYNDYPVPTNDLQAGIFPFKADLTLQPGTNWTFSTTINAHYFLDRLSAYGEYIAVNHSRDCYSNIRMQTCNPNITPPSPRLKKMAEESKWRSHLFNFSLTYDIAPNAILGFLWQAPVGRRNAYRSTTILFSAIFRF